MNENIIDDMIEETKSNIRSIQREERIVNGIAKTGTICGILSLIIIAIAVSCYFLRIFPLIVQYGPEVTMALGTVSTYATFYGWYRILRRKNKEGEAQNRIIAFIKSLPDMFRKMPGSLVSTAALAASVVVGSIAYTPLGEKFFKEEPKREIAVETENGFAEEMIQEIAQIQELIMPEEFPKPKPIIATKPKLKPKSVAIAPLPPPPQPPLSPVAMPTTATASVLVAPVNTPVNMPINTPVHTPMHTSKKTTSGGNSGFFIGLGSEVNNNAKKGNAIGGNMALGYDMNKHFALGVNAVYSNDLEEEITLESKLMLRYYLPVGGPFMQAEAGGALNKSDKNSIVPQGGMAAGWRFSVDKEWFVEPAVRGGYPYVWGTGITLGKKFGH